MKNPVRSSLFTSSARTPNLTAEDLIAFMRQHVTSYKVPRHVYFRTELPKSNVGKILRRALRVQGQSVSGGG